MWVPHTNSQRSLTPLDDEGDDGDGESGDGESGDGASDVKGESQNDERDDESAEAEPENVDKQDESNAKSARKELAKEFAKKIKNLRNSKPGKRKPSQKRKASESSANTKGKSKPARKRKAPESSTNTIVKSPRKSPGRAKSPIAFKVGSRVMGKWKGPDCAGDWYEGVVKSLNKRNQTVHVVYDDGDSDPKLSWANMTVIEM